MIVKVSGYDSGVTVIVGVSDGDSGGVRPSECVCASVDVLVST